MSVLVIGAGVCGLTAAVRLAEAGVPVRVRTDQAPERTTSFAAGAMWGPYLVEPGERLARWGRRTRSVLTGLADDPRTGVHPAFGVEASRVDAEPPAWAATLDDFRIRSSGELPAGYVTGWQFTTLLVEMPRYLAYLAARLAEAGGAIEDGAVASLRAASEAAPVVVNCTGVAARRFVPDEAVVPVRGQIVVVENPGVDTFFAEDPGLVPQPELTYLLPHGDRLILGGTAEAGRFDVEPDPATAAAIVARCAAIEPRVRDARVIAHRVGLRPSRPTVRLERVSLGQRPVIHNYGHGGAGVSLSWGCADDVVELVTSL